MDLRELPGMGCLDVDGGRERKELRMPAEFYVSRGWLGGDTKWAAGPGGSQAGCVVKEAFTAL